MHTNLGRDVSQRVTRVEDVAALAYWLDAVPPATRNRGEPSTAVQTIPATPTMQPRHPPSIGKLLASDPELRQTRVPCQKDYD